VIFASMFYPSDRTLLTVPCCLQWLGWGDNYCTDRPNENQTKNTQQASSWIAWYAEYAVEKLL